MKRAILATADLLAVVWRLLPGRLRLNLVTGLLVLDSRDPDPGQGLRRLLAIRDRLDLVTNERAMAYGRGEHPKHRLTDYHRFFIDRIADGDRVLDVGCGYGAVARAIAHAHPNCTVTGIDMDGPRLAQARNSRNPDNLTFVEGDATRAVPEGGWHVVVLSNVLEHITDRVGFLRALASTTGAARLLIRVPLFERDWQMALRRELGVDFRSDEDHKIEHTLAEFETEVEAAGLTIRERLTVWGEIWADCQAEVSP